MIQDWLNVFPQLALAVSCLTLAVIHAVVVAQNRLLPLRHIWGWYGAFFFSVAVLQASRLFGIEEFYAYVAAAFSATLSVVAFEGSRIRESLMVDPRERADYLLDRLRECNAERERLLAKLRAIEARR